MICIQLIGKRLCVCQVSTEGTCSRGQTGHSDNGQKCADVSVTSDTGYSTHPNLDGCRHLREHSKYACRHCGSEFTERHQLMHHVKTMHHDRQFICPECQRPYVTKCGLTEHVDKIHKKLYRYRCETCGKGFFGRCEYHDHVAAHTGVKRYTCSICDIMFTHKRALKAHVLHIHPNEAANIL